SASLLCCVSPSQPSLDSPRLLLLLVSGHHRDLHSFPTRRSSDLDACDQRCTLGRVEAGARDGAAEGRIRLEAGAGRRRAARLRVDRKSTRLNSSHGSISYAVFCLKKKKTKSSRVAGRE